MNEKRESWDNYFMGLAEMVSTRATCDRKSVGTIIVKDRRVIASGYNGSIKNLEHCSSPEKYYACKKCGKEFDSIPDFPHALSCAGYGYEEMHGGHIMIDNHCQRTVHSELNALLSAARFGVPLDGSTMYCTTFPCWNCFKSIVSAGIVELIYKEEYGESEDNKLVLTAAKKLETFGAIKLRKL